MQPCAAVRLYRPPVGKGWVGLRGVSFGWGQNALFYGESAGVRFLYWASLGEMHMQDNLFDDFGRDPSRKRVDPDQEFGNVRSSFEGLSADELHEAWTMAARYREDKVGSQVLGNGPESAIVVSDAEAFNKLSEAAAAEATRKASGAETSQSPTQTPDKLPGEVAGGAPGSSTTPQPTTPGGADFPDAGGASPKDPSNLPKPTSVESTLASIQLDTGRQERFVILGDEAVTNRFYNKLAERGKLLYQGNTPVIGVSRKEAMKLLKEAASEVPGATAQHALKLDMDRAGFGVVDSVKAGIANAMGRRHEIDVVVVGSQATIDAKLQELGGLVNKLDNDKLLSNKADVKVSDGKLVVPEAGPAELKGSVKLYDLVSMAQDTVRAYAAQEDAKEQARREFRNAKDDKKIAEERGAGTAAGSEAGEVRAAPLNKYAMARVQELGEAMSSSDTLLQKNPDGQSAGAVALRQMLTLKDPASPELATLPDGDRQKAIVQTLALTAKADDKELPDVHRGKPVDASVSAESRDKLLGWVATEIGRDRDFPAKARAMTAELVERGVISDAQANRMLSEAGLGAKAASNEAAPQAAGESAQTATTAQPGQQAKPDSPMAAVDKPEAAVNAPASAAASAPESLRDRLESMTRDGASITPAQAGSVLAELDARRTQPLSSLDAGEGKQPTETLARLKTVLDEAESGRFGKALAAQAGDLRSALDGWEKQDQARPGFVADAVKNADKPAAATGTTPSTSAEVASAPTANPDATQSASPTSPAQASQGGGATSDGLDAGTARSMATAESFAKLSMDMANPAGTFTNRDKTWNEPALQRVAQTIARMDPDAVSQMAPKDQVAVAAYSVWLNDAIGSGKVPGFSSEDGRKLATQVTEKAVAFIQNLPEGAAMSPAVEKQVTKAENMVDAMVSREARLQEQAQGATPTPTKTVDASSLAKDVVHAVYKETELSESYVKYLLKNAEQLTPESIKSLDPESKAKTAAALNFLAGEVRQGALGDFDSLSPGVKKNVIAAQQTADTLTNTLAKEPGMQAELIKANIALTDIAPAEPSLKSASAAGKSSTKVEQSQERSIER